MLIESGTLTFTIPYYLNLSGETETIDQSYYTNLDYSINTGYTSFTGTTYYNSIGQSKISELKKYGTNQYSGVTINGNVSGYTIDNIYYEDYPEGYTMIMGSTSGFTKEEVFQQVITRNEHFLGFIEQPTIFSDVFIERGNQSVMEMNLRLGEVDNIDMLTKYGNGYYTVKKQ
jgi:hypothetical protein